MEKLFKLTERGTTVQREVFAGLTTFLTMAYILMVNPEMLGSIGNGMTKEAVFAATAIASAIATIMMAFTANLPIALAPGMGLNAFFTYTVCMGMSISWQLALTAVFIEGILFIVLSLFNVREAIIKAIPPSLKKAVAAGIGLFIAYIGMKNAGFLHFISDVNIAPGAFGIPLGDGTLYPGQILPGAGVVPELVTFNTAGPILALVGLIVIFVLHALKVPGAILIGIILATLIGIPMGITSIKEGFSIFSVPKQINLFQFDFSVQTLFSFKFLVVIFTFLFVDIFDTVGTLVGVTTKAGLVDSKGGIPRVKQALLSDAVGTAVGAALGTSTVTSYVESAAGVSAGGRTGLTSLTTGILFIIAIFFADLFLLVPGYATAPALIFVGFLMMSPIMTIDFADPVEGIPAFMTVIMMPFTYSIAEGIVWGILTYVLLKFVTKKSKDVSMITWFLFAVFILRFFLH